MSENISESCLDCGTFLELTLEYLKYPFPKCGHIVEKENTRNFCFSTCENYS